MATNKFYPQLAYINAITKAIEAVVTFTAAHDFIVGQIVSFRVQRQFGMREIDQKRGKVLATTSNTITVDINTRDWTAFDYSVLGDAGTTPPICVPCCSGVVEGAIPVTTIEDAFDNRRVS